MSGKRVKRAKEAGRLVDVYSDASHKGAVGAWAAVVVREGLPIVEGSGSLKGDVWNSEIAELRATANALNLGRKRGLIKAGDLVVIRTDNLGNARRIASGCCSPKNPEVGAALDWILALAKAEGFEVMAAHVRGHQAADSVDPHAVHNRRCDELCKRITKAKGGRGPVTIEEVRRAAAVQSSRAKASNARRAYAAAEKLAGRT